MEQWQREKNSASWLCFVGFVGFSCVSRCDDEDALKLKTAPRQHWGQGRGSTWSGFEFLAPEETLYSSGAKG